MNAISKENEQLTTGVETESVEKLLTHIALQTQSIERKLAIIINDHITQDIANYNHEVSIMLSSMQLIK